jgi:signal transduction histidine kinase
MTRTILVFGLVAGFIVSAFMAASMIWVSNHSTTEVSADMDYGMLIGYASQLIAFSFIFVAIKTYRDKSQGGSITFWQACKIGLMISLIASTLYVITWAFIYNYVMPDFMTNYANAALEAAKTAGKSEAEIAALKTEMAGYAEIYKSPIGFTLFTYIEILPTGILVTLISALILWLTRKKPDAIVGV